MKPTWYISASSFCPRSLRGFTFNTLGKKVPCARHDLAKDGVTHRTLGAGVLLLRQLNRMLLTCKQRSMPFRWAEPSDKLLFLPSCSGDDRFLAASCISTLPRHHPR